jgi:hypothetical protein
MSAANSQQMMLASGNAPATITYLATYSPTGTTGTATQTGVGFGSVANHNLIIIAVMWSSGTSGETITSATIGGIPASVALAGGQLGSSAPFRDLAFITAYVPSGTSGTVIVNFSGASQADVRFFVYQATNIQNQAPFGTGSAVSLTTPTSTTCNLKANGIVLAAATTNTVGPFTWTGVNPDYDTSPGVGQNYGGGSALTPSSVTGAPFQFSDPGGTSGGGPIRSLIVASFR